MRILFLEFEKPSHWESCQHILKNLKQAYTTAFPQNLETIPLSLDEAHWEADIRRIKAYGPDLIIFADHRLRVPFWIQRIKQELNGKKLVWGIHVYGCFTGRVDEWISLQRCLDKDEVVFISGTESHSRIVKSFFSNEQNVRTFSFPFLEERSLSAEKRIELRQQYGLREGDIAFVYAGRISYQKNVHHLVKLFSRQAAQDARLKLFVCGMPDDKNPRSIPYAHYMNYTGSLFFQALSEAPAVSYLGSLPHQQLQDFYQACDYVISLSTFYGEDYGLSLIEGLSQGLNCIATNWGGHRDLKPLPQVQLIDVHALDGKLALDEEQLERSFRMLAAPDRKQNLEYFKKLKALDQSALLQDIYQQMVPYGGLSKAAFIFHQRDNEAWRNKEIFEIHEKILRPYWE